MLNFDDFCTWTALLSVPSAAGCKYRELRVIGRKLGQLPSSSIRSHGRPQVAGAPNVWPSSQARIRRSRNKMTSRNFQIRMKLQNEAGSVRGGPRYCRHPAPLSPHADLSDPGSYAPALCRGHFQRVQLVVAAALRLAPRVYCTQAATGPSTASAPIRLEASRQGSRSRDRTHTSAARRCSSSSPICRQTRHDRFKSAVWW